MQTKKLTIVNFSDRFRELVENSGNSQKDLALALGISEGAIVNYKRDRIPKAEELLTICSYFGVTMEWLLTGSGPAPPGVVAGDGVTLKQVRVEAERLARLLGEAEASLGRLRSFLG